MVMVFNATFNNMTSNVKFEKLNENFKKMRIKIIKNQKSSKGQISVDPPLKQMKHSHISIYVNLLLRRSTW